MVRARHPNKHIEEVVRLAEAQGWTLRPMGHWGRLFCSHANRDGCQVSVNGTPRDPDVHARQILRAIQRCPHGPNNDESI